jgi:hypothetical protein
LTLLQRFDLRSGPWGHFPSDADRRAAWTLVRDEMIPARLSEGCLPNGFWQYEPGIPEHLRRLPPMPDQVGTWFEHETGTWRASEAWETAEVAQEAIRRARVRYVDRLFPERRSS